VRAVEQVRSDTPREPAFVDVPFDHWAHDYIQAIYRERYVAGCNLTPLKYCPDVPITRAEVAVVMVRAVHGPDFDPPPASGTIFEDVPAGHWAAKWIEQLWNDGYIAGCSETPRLYCPENPITRAETAVLMVRIVHGPSFDPPAETGTVFDDVLPGAWWSKWIEQLAADGNTQGCSANRRQYCPARPLTRAEMAVFLVRARDISLTPVPSGPYRVYLPLVARNYAGPAPQPLITTVITYTYDPLYRLTGADYSDGKFFHYTYDPVGNRLIQQTLGVTNVYTYDAANRLTSVDGLAYTWDANGNLKGDGAGMYEYDHANRLASVADELHAYTFAYNGLGDRLRQAVNGAPVSYTLDLNAGLTQVLADGTNAYLYGIGRIGEMQPSGGAYHHGDALASVRQLTDGSGAVTLVRSYQPFGSMLSSAGMVSTAYGFTNEWKDATRLVYLRARYYAPLTGLLITRDVWASDTDHPMSYNDWLYVLANPVNYTDPTGLYACQFASHLDEDNYERMGWNYCKELPDAVIALLHEPRNLLSYALYRAIQRFDPVLRVEYYSGGNPHGYRGIDWPWTAGGGNPFVQIPSAGVPGAAHFRNRTLDPNELVYVATVAHEFWHATMQFPGTQDTPLGEADAWAAESIILEELGGLPLHVELTRNQVLAMLHNTSLWEQLRGWIRWCVYPSVSLTLLDKYHGLRILLERSALVEVSWQTLLRSLKSASAVSM
jgi:RHS repeat-associated protein